MSSILYMAWRYLASHRAKTVVLVLAVMLVAYLPAGLHVLVDQSQQELHARAASTPLLIGRRGSQTELALGSLYFRADAPDPLAYREVARIVESRLARAIPLLVRFQSQGDPIVGTNLDYFDFRGLTFADGVQMVRLGDCVLGATVARQRGLLPGSHVVSSPETVFDLTGVYPLKMRVTGILTPTGTPDDEAIFVDIKTAWIIQGLAHGHQDLTSPEATRQVLKRDGKVIVGNASVVEYAEITDTNIDSFHFHGDPADFDLTAVIAIPLSPKSEAILRGQYQGHETLQALQPVTVVDELLETVFTVKRFVIAALVVVSVVTLAVMALVFLLSTRLRAREIDTVLKIGASKWRIRAILSTEIAGVLIAGLCLAWALVWMTAQYGPQIVRSVFLQ